MVALAQFSIGLIPLASARLVSDHSSRFLFLSLAEHCLRPFHFAPVSPVHWLGSARFHCPSLAFCLSLAFAFGSLGSPLRSVSGPWYPLDTFLALGRTNIALRLSAFVSPYLRKYTGFPSLQIRISHSSVWAGIDF